MRRDKELLNKLLLLAEGEEPKPDLSGYTEQQQAYHAAILIDSGLVQGDTVKDAEENVIAAAILDLTPQGHDFLERLRSHDSQSTNLNMIPTEIDIFVSHSKCDQDLAKAIIELLIEALKIPRTRIRCTSVVGHKLSGGTSIETKLRQEINASRLFLGLLTPESLSSAYVMFELGARWGISKSWYLLKAKGAAVDDLKGPLPAYHVLDAGSETDLAQMIEDIGKELAAVPQDFAAFQDKIATVVRLAQSSKGTAPQKFGAAASLDIDDVETVLTAWVGDNLYLLNNVVITFGKLDSELGLPPGSVAAHLEKIAIQAGLKVVRRGRATILFESPEVGGFVVD